MYITLVAEGLGENQTVPILICRALMSIVNILFQICLRKDNSRLHVG